MLTGAGCWLNLMVIRSWLSLLPRFAVAGLGNQLWQMKLHHWKYIIWVYDSLWVSYGFMQKSMSVCRHWAVLGSAAFSPPFVLVTHMVGHGSSWCEPLRELSYRQYGCSLYKTNAELQSYTGQVRPRDFGHLWVSFVDVRVALASPKRRWQIQTILTRSNKQFW